jgi:hypothetical protein
MTTCAQHVKQKSSKCQKNLLVNKDFFWQTFDMGGLSQCKHSE